MLVFPVNENLNYISKIGQFLDYCNMLCSRRVGATRHTLDGIVYTNVCIQSEQMMSLFHHFQLFHGDSILVSTSRRASIHQSNDNGTDLDATRYQD